MHADIENRPEQTISRILSPGRVTPHGEAIIHLGCRLPVTSCDLPGDSGGSPSNAPLFGLAPGGVYQASPVTRGTGALLPHLFTLTGDPDGFRRYLFCGTFLHVAVTPRYGAPCPVVFGLSSRPFKDPAIACSTPAGCRQICLLYQVPLHFEVVEIRFADISFFGSGGRMSSHPAAGVR